MSKWTYELQVCHDKRIYRGGPAGEKTMEGVTWSLDRWCKTDSPDLPEYRQSIVVSPEVFDSQDDALKDALEKLSMLRCPLERPLDEAICGLLGG